MEINSQKGKDTSWDVHHQLPALTSMQVYSAGFTTIPLKIGLLSLSNLKI